MYLSVAIGTIDLQNQVLIATIFMPNNHLQFAIRSGC